MKKSIRHIDNIARMLHNSQQTETSISDNPELCIALLSSTEINHANFFDQRLEEPELINYFVL